MNNGHIADPTPEEWLEALDQGFIEGGEIELSSRQFKTLRETAHLRIELPWLCDTVPPYSESDGAPPAPRRTATPPTPVNPDVEVSPADTELVDDPWT